MLIRITASHILLQADVHVLAAGKHCMRRPAIFLRRASCRHQRWRVQKGVLRSSDRRQSLAKHGSRASIASLRESPKTTPISVSGWRWGMGRI